MKKFQKKIAIHSLQDTIMSVCYTLQRQLAKQEKHKTKHISHFKRTKHGDILQCLQPNRSILIFNSTNLHWILHSRRPKMVVVSNGSNYNGMQFVCFEHSHIEVQVFLCFF